MKKQVWISLIEFKATVKTDIFEVNEKGFTNGLAFAENISEYIDKIRNEFKKIGLEIVNIEDVEPIIYRTKHHMVEKKLLDLAAEVEKYDVIRFGTFHSYLNDIN